MTVPGGAAWPGGTRIVGGGITGGTAATLHRLTKNAAEGRDGTVYGVHSNANYFTHHATAGHLLRDRHGDRGGHRVGREQAHARKLALRSPPGPGPHAVVSV